MFKFKRDVEYNKWIYKDGSVYLTEDYTSIFGVRKQKEVKLERYYDVLLHENITYNYDCE